MRLHFSTAAVYSTSEVGGGNPGNPDRSIGMDEQVMVNASLHSLVHSFLFCSTATPFNEESKTLMGTLRNRLGESVIKPYNAKVNQPNRQDLTRVYVNFTVTQKEARLLVSGLGRLVFAGNLETWSRDALADFVDTLLSNIEEPQE